jgi:hypothetical protein
MSQSRLILSAVSSKPFKVGSLPPAVEFWLIPGKPQALPKLTIPLLPEWTLLPIGQTKIASGNSQLYYL